jgi:hypothetical protein
MFKKQDFVDELFNYDYFKQCFFCDRIGCLPTVSTYFAMCLTHVNLKLSVYEAYLVFLICSTFRLNFVQLPDCSFI